ncbi:hypothetical protein ATK74_1238 [Propionicimonas paludicola]|uniref:Lipoprotein n=1 Tax=Propionicimonas paludicola TaxID=185243 RepID=A0A2A9CQD9_9ACTN|nr:hypothetical protein [Propionicimonas paludicola]PFG16687.1 hypothetical protein ATK74_1238 [Propionicimonas paludicola]
MGAAKALLTRVGSFLALSCLVVVAGCSASVQPPTTPGNPSPSGAADPQIVQDARTAGADASQIAILKKGDVSYADYESAVNLALTCMRKAGIDVLPPQRTDRTGLPQLNYGWSSQVTGMTEEQATALGDDCLKRYSQFVEMQYQTQPSSIEAMEKYFVKFRPAVVACIRKNGGTVKDEPTREEAIQASNPVEDRSGVDCFEKAGVSKS